MRLFGLIGYPLSHSFSKKYFTEKFKRENITDSCYELFEIPDAMEVFDLVERHPDLAGLNVTIPHKEAIIPFLDELDEPVKQIGAVNVIKVLPNGKLKGYNSDFHGFKKSLLSFLPSDCSLIEKALVLGTGGAAKAVKAVLKSLNIPYTEVSRKSEGNTLGYENLSESVIKKHKLIINTTPLGMHPKTQSFPAIPYQHITEEHYLFDLVYNPEETVFMKMGAEKGARTKNGLEMLTLQAEKAWNIWNS